LARAAIEIVGKASVCLGDGVERYAWDALGPARAYRDRAKLPPQPLLVARPRSTEEVSALMRVAGEEAVPVVPYGGGSGLMGGAIAVNPSLVIDLKAMDMIIAVDPEDSVARVQAGVILGALERRLNRKRLMLGHDPWSLPLATVGGAIATDSLGYRGARYGSMGDQVLGLTVVLPDGRIVSTHAVSRAAVGLDLNRLLIGSEGCFGIITEAAIRVYRRPEKRTLRAYRFLSFEEGFQAIAQMHDVGLRPALLDYGEQYRAGATEPTPATLYLAFEGYREEVAAQDSRARLIARDRGGQALPAREAREFWNERHDAAERFAERRASRDQPQAPAAGLDFVHVSLPRSRVLAYRKECQELLRRHGVTPLEYGIWCWPELFSVVVTGPTEAAGGGEALARAVDELLMLAQDMGGSMEYCHGVGVRLAHLMGRELGQGLEVVRTIKGALDPRGVMNPGKLGL
jgi:alkyldihydroxyacetonephosphate synthase